MKKTSRFMNLLYKYAAERVAVENVLKVVGTAWHMNQPRSCAKICPSFLFFLSRGVS